MLFSSFSFLFWFLPLVLLFCFLPQLWWKNEPRRLLLWQNAVLLVASLFFYAWGEPIYVLLLLATTLANAALAARIPHSKRPRLVLLFAVALDVGLLVLFKYPPLVGLPAPRLPLGISFYTFQALSYVSDVYRGHAKVAKSPLTVCLYVSLFPQLIAGPIVRYTEVEEALVARRTSLCGAARGITLFAVGLAKKVLLANAAGALFAAATTGEATTAVAAWLALLGFTFQIYFDFSGYSDMAKGLGHVFGFRFPDNFHYPYTASSVTDFWRRWHITLSAFFKEYVYIPLGGNRRGSARTVLNLLIVWSLTGLWHGASLNFLLWGLYYFLLLLFEKLVWRERLTRVPRPLRVALTFTATLGGWLLFAFDGSTRSLELAALPRFFLALFGAGGLARGNDLYELVRSLPLLALCALGATPLPARLTKRVFRTRYGVFLRVVLPLFALVLCISALADAAYNPFLYFRF